MGAMKKLWVEEQEKLGLAGDGVFSDYVNDEVWAMRSEVMHGLNKVMVKDEIVRDEWDLWATHDGQGDN
jgi:hypothetical protein